MKKLLSLVCVMLSCQVMGDPIIWGSTPTTISTSGVNSTNVEIGIDGNGNAAAVWIEGGYLKTRSCPYGGSWGTLTTLSSMPTAVFEHVVDFSGTATAIWVEAGAIKTASCPAGGSWSAVTTLAISGSSLPQVCTDENNNLAAIWVQNGAINSSTCLVGGSWSSVSTISSSGTNPQIAISSNGMVAAVWRAVNLISSTDTIFGSTKTLTGIWSTGQAISNPSQNSVHPQVAIDGSGNVLAVWFSFTTSGIQYMDVTIQSSSLLASQFTWSTPVSLSQQGLINPAKLFLQVMFNIDGYAVAAWTNSYDGENYNLQSSLFSPSTGWSTFQNVAEDPNLYSAGFNVSPVGDAFIAYMVSDAGTSGVDILTQESVLGGVSSGTWFNQQTVSTNVTNGYPRISVCNGATMANGVVGWVTFDGSNTVIQAINGSANLLVPPADLVVTQSSQNNNIFTQYNNTLTWSGSDSSEVTAYLIYRNGIFITDVSVSSLQFIDLNRVVGVNDTYGVASFNDDTGEQSSIVSITLP